MKAVLVLLMVLGTVAAASSQPWQGFTALTLSADGRFFATGGREGEVLWWESSTGEPVSRWVRPGGGPVVALAFLPDGSQLGAALLDGTIAAASPGSDQLQELPAGNADWKDLAGAKERWIASGPLTNGVRIAVGLYWAQGTPDGQITVGRQSDGKPVAAWAAHAAAVTGLVLAADGSFLLSCSYNGDLCRWDPQTGQLWAPCNHPILDARL